MISKLRLDYGIFEYSAVIQSVSVGIKAKPHFATLDCHVATSLLLAMTNGKLTSNLPFAHKVRFTKQIILRNCGLIVYPVPMRAKHATPNNRAGEIAA